MPLKNKDIADFFLQYADSLEAKTANPFRIKAYRRAADNIQKLTTELEVLVAENYDLTRIPGIGKMMAGHIRNFVESQELRFVFPKLKRKALKTLDIDTAKKLKNSRFYRLFRIIPVVEVFLRQVQYYPGISHIEVAGDFRRKKEIIHELEFVLYVKESTKAIYEFLKILSSIQAIAMINSKLIILQFWNGIVANLRLVSKNEIAAALIFYTGSSAHWKALVKHAQLQDITLNHRGVFKKVSNKGVFNRELFNKKKRIETISEQEIYATMGLQYIPPELRENRGEISAAAKQDLPNLIEISQIRGDLHAHTHATDGKNSLEEMAEAAMALGYEYLAITDHSQSLKIAKGMNKKQLLAQIKKIDRFNDKLGRQFLLKSSEIDILENGDLDFPNSVLKELDLTVCSVHSKFKLPASQQTDRILRAMDNPYFNILGHATGRLIYKREPYGLDMEKILQAAKDRNCVIEINAQPYRLDIHDVYCQTAKKMGIKMAISSDAHSIRELNFMKYGIYHARRGWVEASDVINTRSFKDLKKLIRRV